MKHNVDQTSPYLAQHRESEIGEVSLVNITDTESLESLMQKYAEPNILTGASETSTMVHNVGYTPDTSWANFGKLSSILAPDGGYVSVENNNHPRDNIGACLRSGCVFIENTGSVNITISARGYYMQAMVMETDNDSIVVNQFSNAYRLSAPMTRQSHAGLPQEAASHTVAVDTKEAARQVAERVTNSVGKRIIDQHLSRTGTRPETNHHETVKRVGEAIGAVGTISAVAASGALGSTAAGIGTAVAGVAATAGEIIMGLTLPEVALLGGAIAGIEELWRNW
jgi:hypothetical protein